MKRFNANEWQEFSLKKDVEKIYKKLSENNNLEFVYLIQIIIAFSASMLSVSLDNWNLMYYWVIVTLILLIPIAIFKGYMIYNNCKEKNYNPNYINNVNIKKYIDVFDDEITYNVQMSESYYRMLKENLQESYIDFDGEIILFYYIESSYYANKAVDGLLPLSCSADKILVSSVNEVMNNKNSIIYERYYNIYKILVNQYKLLEDGINNIPSTDSIENIIEMNKRYKKKLCSTICPCVNKLMREKRERSLTKDGNKRIKKKPGI